MTAELDQPNINDVRTALLGGTTDMPTLAAAMGCSVRKVERMISQGLPVIRIGRDRRFNVEQCRDWLLSRQSSRRAARGPGRPTTNRAA